MTSTELLPQILKLSAEEQLMIAEAIRSNLAGQTLRESRETFNAELDRRHDDLQRNPQEEASWEDVKARLRSQS